MTAFLEQSRGGVSVPPSPVTSRSLESSLSSTWLISGDADRLTVGAGVPAHASGRILRILKLLLRTTRGDGDAVTVCCSPDPSIFTILLTRVAGRIRTFPIAEKRKQPTLSQQSSHRKFPFQEHLNAQKTLFPVDLYASPCIFLFSPLSPRYNP